MTTEQMDAIDDERAGRTVTERVEKAYADSDMPITMAEEPIEHRLLRAYLNGFRDGAERAARGRWDA